MIIPLSPKTRFATESIQLTGWATLNGYLRAVMTWARILPSISPWPKRSASADATASVTVWSPPGARASISTRKGIGARTKYQRIASMRPLSKIG